jgi:vacuolar-type H+-ATPase subunit E/Vma4
VIRIGLLINFEKPIIVHMQTIRLRVSEKIIGNLLSLLSRFNKEEIEIITEDDEFVSAQNYLKDELRKLEEGKATYITLEELDRALEEKIKGHENNHH